MRHGVDGDRGCNGAVDDLAASTLKAVLGGSHRRSGRWRAGPVGTADAPLPRRRRPRGPRRRRSPRPWRDGAGPVPVRVVRRRAARRPLEPRRAAPRRRQRSQPRTRSSARPHVHRYGSALAVHPAPVREAGAALASHVELPRAAGRLRAELAGLRRRARVDTDDPEDARRRPDVRRARAVARGRRAPCPSRPHRGVLLAGAADPLRPPAVAVRPAVGPTEDGRHGIGRRRRRRPGEGDLHPPQPVRLLPDPGPAPLVGPRLRRPAAISSPPRRCGAGGGRDAPLDLHPGRLGCGTRRSRVPRRATSAGDPRRDGRRPGCARHRRALGRWSPLRPRNGRGDPRGADELARMALQLLGRDHPPGGADAVDRHWNRHHRVAHRGRTRSPQRHRPGLRRDGRGRAGGALRRHRCVRRHAAPPCARLGTGHGSDARLRGGRRGDRDARAASDGERAHRDRGVLVLGGGVDLRAQRRCVRSRSAARDDQSAAVSGR